MTRVETIAAIGRVGPSAASATGAGAAGRQDAEHGVGQLKKPWLTHYRGGTELEVMKTLKKALDPANILNPGKLF